MDGSKMAKEREIPREFDLLADAVEELQKSIGALFGKIMPALENVPERAVGETIEKVPEQQLCDIANSLRVQRNKIGEMKHDVQGYIQRVQL